MRCREVLVFFPRCSSVIYQSGFMTSLMRLRNFVESLFIEFLSMRLWL